MSNFLVVGTIIHIVCLLCIVFYKKHEAHLKEIQSKKEKYNSDRREGRTREKYTFERSFTPTPKDIVKICGQRPSSKQQCDGFCRCLADVATTETGRGMVAQHGNIYFGCLTNCSLDMDNACTPPTKDYECNSFCSCMADNDTQQFLGCLERCRLNLSSTNTHRMG